MYKKFLFIALLTSCCTLAYGQVTVNGYFLSDSVKIGENIPYVLTARYPSEQNVLFPDSTFSFAPFEFQSKVYFPTRTIADLSYDSVLYNLATFEIDSIQRLGLPVFVVHPSDCTAIRSIRDSIYLQLLVAQVPDSVSAENLPLKTNTEYLNVRWIFNYPLLLIIVVALLVLLIAIWVIFGRRIRKYFMMKRLNKKHFAFLEKFGVLTSPSDFSLQKGEAALILWKKYIEELENKPFTKYTSKEILQYENDERLGSALMLIDRMIYGGNVSSTESFVHLRSYSEQEFQKQIDKVTHE